jgi:1-acyl-sn-glycerol-3-phosphate acyltransferase
MRTGYAAARTLANGLLRLLLRREVTGLEHLPRSGPVLVAANHASFWDPPVLGATLPRELAIMTRASFFAVPGFGALIRSLGAFPVAKGAPDLRAFRRARSVLEGGGALLVFPEGGRMKDGRLHPGLPGVGLLAAHTRAPIVPLYVAGTNRIRRSIARRAPLRIAIGVPLPAALWATPGSTTTRTGRALHQEIADRTMQEIARLRDEVEAASAATSTSLKPEGRASSRDPGGSS